MFLLVIRLRSGLFLIDHFHHFQLAKQYNGVYVDASAKTKENIDKVMNSIYQLKVFFDGLFVLCQREICVEFILSTLASMPYHHGSFLKGMSLEFGIVQVRLEC